MERVKPEIPLMRFLEALSRVKDEKLREELWDAAGQMVGAAVKVVMRLTPR